MFCDCLLVKNQLEEKMNSTLTIDKFLGSAATAYMLLVIAILLFAILVFRNSPRQSGASR